MGGKRDIRTEIAKRSEEATLLAIKRICEMLDNPDTPGAEALKAAALVLERVSGARTAQAAENFSIQMKGE